jgi:hypothetical protein
MVNGTTMSLGGSGGNATSNAIVINLRGPEQRLGGPDDPPLSTRTVPPSLNLVIGTEHHVIFPRHALEFTASIGIIVAPLFSSTK